MDILVWFLSVLFSFYCLFPIVTIGIMFSLLWVAGRLISTSGRQEILVQFLKNEQLTINGDTVYLWTVATSDGKELKFYNWVNPFVGKFFPVVLKFNDLVQPGKQYRLTVAGMAHTKFGVYQNVIGVDTL